MKTKKNKTHLYIDGDMLVYRVGYASEHTGNFIDGTSFKDPDFALAKRLAVSLLSKWCSQFGVDYSPENYTVVTSCSENWRFDIFPAYKANRKVLTKPLCYDKMRKWLASLPNAEVTVNEEADDWLARRAVLDPNAVVITADKDFYNVPGKVFNISSERLYHPTESQAFCFLFFQALVGDRVDGYFGVPWVGNTKAVRLLKACNRKTIRSSYLLLKREVFRRGKTRDEKKDLWNSFRTCLDLASLLWPNEQGTRGVGLRRVYRLRGIQFEFYLPYYDVHHTVKYGKVITQKKKGN